MNRICRNRKKSSSQDSSFTVQQGALMAVFFIVLVVTLQAAPPAWWSATSGPLNSNPANDYAAANQGQLKQFTQKAVSYMDANLPGGAGTTLDSMVSGWSNDYAANGYSSANPAPADFKAINQGQLKYVANKVWSRLVAAGYANTAPTWIAVNANTDYRVANIGQLKTVFNFDLKADSDHNGLLDWWERKYFGATGATTGYTANSIVDGNGLTLLQDFQQGNNPTNYYSQGGTTITPTILIVSGNNQGTLGGHYAPIPLKIKVTDANHNPLFNAPVTFVVTSGSGQIAATVLDVVANSLQVVTDFNGNALVYYLQPSNFHVTGAITATAGGQFVTFSEVSTANVPGDGAFDAPTNVIGRPSGTTEIDLTWQNHANAASGILIQESTDGVTWTTIATLGDPTATSYAVTGLTAGQSYSFRVSASGSSGSTSTSSSSQPTMPNSPPPPIAAVSDLTGTLDTGGTMTLSWTPVPGASTYNVEREVLDGSGTWTTLSSASSATYSDTSRQIRVGYKYRISTPASGTNAATTSAVYPPTQYAVIDLGSHGYTTCLNNIGSVVMSDNTFWKNGTTTQIPIGSIVGLDNNDRMAGTQSTNEAISSYPDVNNTTDQQAVVWTGTTTIVLGSARSNVLGVPDVAIQLGDDTGGSIYSYSSSAISDNYVVGSNHISNWGWGTGFGSMNDDGTYPEYHFYYSPGLDDSGGLIWTGNNPSFTKDFGPGTNFYPSGVNNFGAMIGFMVGGGTSGPCIDSGNNLIPLSFNPTSINDAGTVVGYQSPTGTLGYINGSSQVLPHTPIKINNVGTHGQILDGEGWVWNYDSVNTIYKPQNIADYIADGSPWSSLFYLSSINDNGVLVGDAVYTPTGSADPIAAGAHCVMLVPMQLDYITRDPDTGMYSKMGGIISESLPTPEVSVNATNTQIDSSGNLVVNLTIQIRDPLSEIATANHLNRATIYVDEQPYEVINNLSSQAGGGAVPVWQPYSSQVTLTRSITIPQPHLGTTNIRVQTDPNGAGNVGWAGVGVTLARHPAQLVNASPNRSIKFTLPGSLSDQVVEQISLQVDGQATSSLTETAANSNTFNGIVTTTAGNCTASLYLQKGLTLNATQLDAVKGILELTDPSGNVVDSLAEWTETGANTLIFNPDTFYLLDEENSNALYIESTTPESQSDKGDLEPFVVRIAVPDSIATVLQDPNGWIQFKLFDQNVTLAKQDDLIPNDTPPVGTHYYYIASNNAPELFAVVRQFAGSLIPQSVLDQSIFKVQIAKNSDSSIILDGETSVELQPATNGTAQFELQTLPSRKSLFAANDNLTILRILAENQIAQTTPAYTWDDILMWFNLMYGPYGDVLLHSFSQVGGTIDVTPLTHLYYWDGYRIQNPLQTDEANGKKAIIHIDSGRRTSIEAAQALYRAFQSLRSNQIYYRSDLDNEVISELPDAVTANPDDANLMLQFSAGNDAAISEALGDCVCAMETGLSLNPAAGLAFTAGDVTDAARAGHFQVAGLNIAFAAVLCKPIRKYAIRTASHLDFIIGSQTISFDKDVLSALDPVLGSSRWQSIPRYKIMDALAPYIANGKLSKDAVALLYNERFLYTSRTALERNMVAAGMGSKPYGYETHHLLSLAPSEDEGQLELKFLQTGLDPSDALYGQYLSKEFHALIHNPNGGGLDWGPGGAWNYQWKRFFQDKPNATAADVYDFLHTWMLPILSTTQTDVSKMNWFYFP